MGIKGTYKISREVAQQVVITKLYSMTDQELADVLEMFNESYFRNYCITDNNENTEDHMIIRSVSEFMNCVI
jgi:hypothetical protein